MRVNTLGYLLLVAFAGAACSGGAGTRPPEDVPMDIADPDTGPLADTDTASDEAVGDAPEPPEAGPDLPPLRAVTFDEYGGLNELPVPNDSGFFRTVRVGDRWMLATPAGHAFLSQGVNTLDFEGDHCPSLGYSPLERTNRGFWGADEEGRDRYFAASLDLLRSAGINTITGWTSEAGDRIRRRSVAPMPYMATLGFSSVRGDGPGQIPPVGPGGRFPDVFHPDFAAACRAYAAAVIQPAWRDDPYLVGYFTDNELPWFGSAEDSPSSRHGLADDFLSLGPDAAGKKAFVDLVLRQRGRDLAALNAAWGTSFATEAEVAAATHLPDDPAFPDRATDKSAFVGLIATAWFQAVHAALREVDPNHLDLCPRFAIDVPLEVAAAASTCDVVTLNDYYTDGFTGTVGLASGETEARCSRIALAAGGGTSPRPMFLSEFGIRAADSGLMNAFGAGFVVDTQAERGAYYRRTTDALLGFRAGGVGYLTGFHWFEWRDEPKLGRFDAEHSNYGFVSVDGAPYRTFVEAVASQNVRIVDRMLGGEGAVLATPGPLAVAGAPGNPTLEWAPVAGAATYRVRVSPAAFFPGAQPRSAWDGRTASGPGDLVVVVEEPRAALGDRSLAAGTWFVSASARFDGHAAPSDYGPVARVEVQRRCPAGVVGDAVLGCYTAPPPPEGLLFDGWARVDPVRLQGDPEPWVSLRFLVSGLGENHPRTSGEGVEIVVGYAPPVPAEPGSMARWCASPVAGIDGVRVPSTGFVRARYLAVDGAVLAEGPLDGGADALVDGCRSAPVSPDAAVARVEYYVDTADLRIPLDVPVEVLVKPLGLGTSRPPSPPLPPVLPVPQPRQRAWQDLESMMFIHYGVNTFTGRQWGLGNEDPAVFAPTDLDANRWARIAREAGFKGIVLTAKHHDGFCLWPSALTDHSVAASPWRGGKGDLVREVADACRDQGLRFGVYLSPWDRHEPTYGTPAYDDYYVGQLEELLTNYGPVAEVWLDGAIDPNLTAYAYDTARYYDTMRRLQPGAVIAVNGPDVRWVGNEDGRADETQWSPQPAGEPPVDVWYPSECDVANRLWGQWFWNPGNELWVRPAEALVEIFFTSVGRNCGLLLNLPPNPEGRFGAEDLDALTGFRRTLDRIFETDLARGAAATASGTRNGDDRSYGPDNVTDGTPDTFWAVDDGQGEAWIEVVLGAPATFDVVSLSEPVEYGQRVASHRIEVPDGNGWRTIAQGTTIGHRRLHRIDPTTADRVRLVIDDARGAPAIRAFGLYRAGTP